MALCLNLWQAALKGRFPNSSDSRSEERIPARFFYTRLAGKQIRTIDMNRLELCQSYPWPGNIRELQNIVERSVILSSGDTFSIERLGW
jgi:transcriptional regulator with AAA-type ATPase domain